MTKLTKQQINRQDFVDNQIFDLINNLLPPPKQIDWNIEIIASVRDAIREEIVDKKKLMSEARFYPFIKI